MTAIGSTLYNIGSTAFQPIVEMKDIPILNTIGTLARATFALISEAYKAPKGLHLFVQLTGVTTLISAFVFAKDFIKNGVETGFIKWSLNHLPDRAIFALENGSDFLDYLATGSSGLVSLGILPETLLGIINPVGLVAALVSSIGLIYCFRGYQEAKALLVELNSENPSLQDKGFALKNFIGIDSDIAKNLKNEASTQQKRALKTRISQRINSLALKATITVIAVVATLALTFSTLGSIIIAAQASLAILALLSAYRQGYDARCNKEFLATINNT